MRNFLIRLLFRLLSHQEKISDGSQREIDEWLRFSYRSPGFHAYILRENLSCLKQGMNSVNTDSEYQQLVGMRFGLKKITSLAKDAHIKYIRDESKKRPMQSENVQREVDSLERTL